MLGAAGQRRDAEAAGVAEAVEDALAAERPHEAMVALVLAEAATEKFGGDSVAEIRRNVAGYVDSLPLR